MIQSRWVVMPGRDGTVKRIARTGGAIIPVCQFTSLARNSGDAPPEVLFPTQYRKRNGGTIPVTFLNLFPGPVWFATTRKRAPHKPILLLAVLDPAARGGITSPSIDVTGFPFGPGAVPACRKPPIRRFPANGYSARRQLKIKAGQFVFDRLQEDHA